MATRLDAFRARGEAGDTFERLDAGLYAEHGVFASTMIGTKIIYGSARSAGPGFENTASGIVEVEGFAQRTIASGAFGVVSARTAIARPASLAAGARPGLAADGVDLEARALYGIGFGGPVAGFFSLEAAYRGRTGLAADQARFDAILGFEPHQDFLLMAEAQTAFSVGDPRPGGADFDVVKLQPSIVWRANSKFALRAGGLIEVASRNLTPGRGVFISFWSEF
ncbi:MAG: hypothetical protein AAFX08_02970 [Pseudomonadota bacterium]